MSQDTSPENESPDRRTLQPLPPGKVGPAARAGLPVPEYDRRVWDMAKHLIHPAALYVLIQVLALTRLLAHPWFREPDAGKLREIPFFVAGFLGAWAVFYSTLMRDAGLRSWTVTLLVPAALLALLALYFVFPDAEHMTTREFWTASACVLGPAPIAWAATMVRWHRSRRATAHLRPGEEDA